MTTAKASRRVLVTLALLEFGDGSWLTHVLSCATELERTLGLNCWPSIPVLDRRNEVDMLSMHAAPLYQCWLHCNKTRTLHYKSEPL